MLLLLPLFAAGAAAGVVAGAAAAGGGAIVVAATIAVCFGGQVNGECRTCAAGRRVGRRWGARERERASERAGAWGKKEKTNHLFTVFVSHCPRASSRASPRRHQLVRTVA